MLLINSQKQMIEPLSSFPFDKIFQYNRRISFPAQPRSRGISLAKIAIGATITASAVIGLFPGRASAYNVTVDGLDYDVTTFFGSYNSNVSKFQTAANSGVMPWWGDRTLAVKFSSAVAGNLGTPNTGGTRGPYFAHLFENVSYDRVEAVFDDPNSSGINLVGSEVVYYAQAVIISPTISAVPGPLPLFGTAAAFCWSRQLRRRIKTSV